MIRMRTIVVVISVILLLSSCVTQQAIPTNYPVTPKPSTSPVTVGPTQQAAVTPTPENNLFVKLSDSVIAAPDGTEYIAFCSEWIIQFTGEMRFVGFMEGEMQDPNRESYQLERGLYAHERDLTNSILVRIPGDYSPQCLFYMRSDLLPYDLGIEKINHIAFIEYSELKSYDQLYQMAVERKGITDKKIIEQFFNDLEAAPDSGDTAGSGYGEVYGFYDNEMYFARPFAISYKNDGTVLISLVYPNPSYCDIPLFVNKRLPDKWIEYFGIEIPKDE